MDLGNQIIDGDREDIYMNRRAIVAGVLGIAVGLGSGALAQQTNSGNAADAKAMLQKTISAIKADKARALDMIAKGEDGFLKGDLYPWCFNASDGKIHPFPNLNAKALFGRDERSMIDAAGKNYGQHVFEAAQKPEGVISEVTYLFSKPMEKDKPYVKVSFVTRIGDLGCGVGYYK